MNDVLLLSHLLDKNLHEKYCQHINLDFLKQTAPELFKIHLVLAKVHSDGQDVPTVDDLRALFFNQYPGLKKADIEAYNLLFDTAKAVNLADSTIQTLLQGHIERSNAFQIAQIAYEVSEGKKSLETLYSALEAHKPRLIDEEITYVTDNLAELYEQTFARPGLKWRSKTMRKSIGSLRQGDFGFLFTRPEVGKTTFVADNVSYMASQTDRPVLHFNNEEMGSKVKIRYFQACLGLKSKELFSDLEGNERKYLDLTHGNIKLLDVPSLEKSRVEDVCAKENPALIVIDSIDKIKGFAADRDDLVYKQIYQWARELAKTYGSVIGVCHAAASAEGKTYLEMDDVAYAKTTKQGEADWILGIGQSHEDGKENLRYFHTPKNKLLGDDETDEQYRHGKLIMRINPEIARFEDVLTFKEQ